MTSTSYGQTSPDWFTPHPHQDSHLLQQIGFIPGLKELLMARQVHALEHATVWVLSEMAHHRLADPDLAPDNESLGGLSTDQGFYLYGQVSREDLQRAVNRALERLRGGEWDLAVHPRCGTNLSVSLMVTAGFILGAHLLLPRGPLSQLLGVGLAASTAFQIAPDLGMSAQKYLTTAIPFNLAIAHISRQNDLWGRPAYFVRVTWRDSQ
jgi:Domain of unknown function (DUF6391)